MADFEQASRIKLRYTTCQGLLSVEDLWDLPLRTPRSHQASLDGIAVTLYKELQQTAGLSFVEPPDTEATARTQLMFDLVKHVIDVRLAETAAAEAKRDAAARKARLLELIATKEDEQLSGHSLEELRAMVNAL